MALRIPSHARQIRRLLDSRIATYTPVRGLRTRPTRTNSTPQSSDQNATDGQQSVESQPPSSPALPPDVSAVLSNLDPSQNQLLAPVHIPEDKNAVLKSDHPATNILAQSGIVVTRQIEMMNVFLGFEQANRYVIMDPQGNHIGYMAEHDGGIAKTMGRQWFKTHRAFTTHVFDKHAQEVLRFHRPFSWINSRIRVYDALEPGSHAPTSDVTALSENVQQPQTIDGTHAISNLPVEAMRIIGETHSEWAPMRRKYNLFLAHEIAASSSNAPVAGKIGTEPTPSDLSAVQQSQAHGDNFAQFAYVDEPFLSWDFSLRGADGKLIGSVNRNWRGFGRELFTDTGMYVLQMDSAALESEAAKSHVISQSHQGERAYAEAVGGDQSAIGMTLDQRALMLATAVTLDFDYFSRHSGSGSGWMLPLWMGGGGEAAGGAAGAGAAGAEAGAAGAGAAEAGGMVAGGAGRGVAGAASEIGAGEGAIAGAGTMAGYEAMQRGMGRREDSGAVDPPMDTPRPSNDPDSPQYGGGYDSESPQGGYSDSPPEDQDVWGSGSKDPWSESPPTEGSGGSGEGGGILSDIWNSFFD